MSLQPFQPKGERPEWKMVYDLIAGRDVNSVVTYDELTEALGRPYKRSRSPFYRANKILLEVELKGLDCVTKVGYRVITAEEHEKVARTKHRSAGRSLRKAQHWLAHTDRKQLTPEAAARIDRLEVTMSRHIDFTKRLDDRLSTVQTAVEESRQKQERTAEETQAQFARLKAALERQGIDVDT